MRDQELVNALRRLKVEIGSLACLGCGHEHNWMPLPEREAKFGYRNVGIADVYENKVAGIYLHHKAKA